MSKNIQIVAREAAKKDGFVTFDVLRLADAELRDLGWHKDYSRPLVRDVSRGPYYPWWLSPDGVSVRGIKAACALAVMTSLPAAQPSKPWVPCDIAVRCVQALRGNPSVLEDVRRLLEAEVEQSLQDTDSEAAS